MGVRERSGYRNLASRARYCTCQTGTPDGALRSVTSGFPPKYAARIVASVEAKVLPAAAPGERPEGGLGIGLLLEFDDHDLAVSYFGHRANPTGEAPADRVTIAPTLNHVSTSTVRFLTKWVPRNARLTANDI